MENWVCTQCGTQNAETAKYCCHCAQPHPQAQLQCPQCGKANPARNRYCSGCGMDLFPLKTKERLLEADPDLAHLNDWYARKRLAARIAGIGILLSFLLLYLWLDRSWGDFAFDAGLLGILVSVPAYAVLRVQRGRLKKRLENTLEQKYREASLRQTPQ